MYIISIILAGVLLAFFSNPQDKLSYHKSVLAIFGIAYFIIWRFLAYYAAMATWTEAHKLASFTVLVLIALGLVLTKWMRYITPLPANSLVVLFFICVVATFVLEKDIKNIIAEKGGLFDSSYPFSKSDHKQYKSMTFSYKEGGFTISLPEAWQQKEHRSGHKQFVRLENKHQLATLSPTCFHDSDISLYEIINNIKILSPQATIKHECFINDQGYYTCFVRSQGAPQGNIHEKWQWFVTDKRQNQSIELNFVFYNESQQSRHEAEFIIRSLAITPLESPLPYCINSLDWQ